MKKIAKAAKQPIQRFGFILTSDFSLLAFSCFVEALRELEDHGELTGRRFCQWSVLGKSGTAVRSSCGIELSTSRPFEDPGAFDYVVVIGGRLEAQVSPAALRFLAKAAKIEKTIIAIDTGTFVVARAGLMKDRNFCLDWFHYREFKDEFPEMEASIYQIFLIDRNFISCAGGTWSTDLAAHLIASIWGDDEASRAISLMGLERMRSASHYQTPFFDGAPVVTDSKVRAAIQMIERNCSKPPTVAEIATRSGLSVRQLERRFHTAVGVKPGEFSRTLRLRFGHWLLLNSQRSIAQIAFDCGFSDQSHFTREMRRAFNSTPRILRQQKHQSLNESERNI